MLRVMLRMFVVVNLAVAGSASAQVKPQPFPKPGSPPAERPVTPQEAPVVRSTPPAPPQDTSEPAEGSLGVPIHEAAQYITSYDAGRGQRFYLYGTNATFAEIVQYYKTALKQRGDLVFPEPPIHQFDIGRFREETMAFPPSVTVKDYTWGGSAGYLNPKRGGQPARFATIIQVVPNPSK
jgi:hypothetical protein